MEILCRRWQVEHLNVCSSKPRSPGLILANPIRCLQAGHIGRATSTLIRSSQWDLYQLPKKRQSGIQLKGIFFERGTQRPDSDYSVGKLSKRPARPCPSPHQPPTSCQNLPKLRSSDAPTSCGNRRVSRKAATKSSISKQKRNCGKGWLPSPHRRSRYSSDVSHLFWCRLGVRKSSRPRVGHHSRLSVRSWDALQVQPRRFARHQPNHQRDGSGRRVRHNPLEQCRLGTDLFARS